MVTSVLSDDQLGAVHQLLDRIRARQLKDFGQIGSDVKPDGSLITACDRWSDAALVEGLVSIAPGEGVLSEEGSKTVPNTQAYWVVDPLDGTTNFAAGIPYWAISVARFVDGRPSEVFLDVPALNQRFVALRGRGATRNNQPITHRRPEPWPPVLASHFAAARFGCYSANRISVFPGRSVCLVSPASTW